MKIKNVGTPSLTVKNPLLKISSDKGFAMDTKSKSIEITKKVIKTVEKLPIMILSMYFDNQEIKSEK